MLQSNNPDISHYFSKPSSEYPDPVLAQKVFGVFAGRLQTFHSPEDARIFAHSLDKQLEAVKPLYPEILGLGRIAANNSSDVSSGLHQTRYHGIR